MLTLSRAIAGVVERFSVVLLFIFAVPFYMMFYIVFVASLPALAVLNGCFWVLTGETWGTHPMTRRVHQFVVDMVP